MCEWGPVVMFSEVADQLPVSSVVELVMLLIEAHTSSVHHRQVTAEVIHVFNTNVSNLH